MYRTPWLLAGCCLLALSVLVSCSPQDTRLKSQTDVAGADDGNDRNGKNAEREVAVGDGKPEAGTSKPSADVLAVAKGNNEFAFDLYRQLAKEAKPDENICFSPSSISSAFAMTYAGARGKTAAQMSKVLRFDKDQGKFHPAFAALSRQVRAPGKGFEGEVHAANAIWTVHNVRESFRDVMARHYESGIRQADFSDSEAVRKEINDWVAEQTRERIGELLPERSINHNTRSVLVNAFYLRAKWQTPFDEWKTKDEPFFRSPKDTVKVPMMCQTATLRYAKLGHAEAVELPYAGRQFSMVLLLPASHAKMADLEKGLPDFGEWVGQLKKQFVEVALPRLKLARYYPLKPALEEIGLNLPFSPEADFSGISPRFTFLGAVHHKATLDVDEVGTTAAAATALVEMRSFRLPKARVRFDRPFLLCLMDARQRTVLFVARVMSPTAVK